MREKEIENYFVKQVQEKNGIAIKLNSTTMFGLPDRLVLLPEGIVFFAELKAPGQKPRTLQQFVHCKLKKLGFDIYVIDSKQQVREVLANYEVYTA